MFVPRNVPHLGSQRQLFLDDELIDELVGFRRRLGTPERHPANPILRAERPWEQRYPYIWGSVIPDASGGYRMWYYSWPKLDSVAAMFEGGSVISYATSPDGIHWERPNLGLHAWGDRKDTNLVLIGPEMPSIVEKPDDPDPQRRFRLLSLSKDRMTWNMTYSADGLHWSEPHKLWHKYNELIRDFAMLVWDPYGQRWLMPCKLCRSAGHAWPDWPIRRCIGLTTSEDGEHWDVPELIITPDELDDQQSMQRNLQDRARLSSWRPEEAWCDFQVMAIWPYEGLYIGWICVNDVSGLSPYSNNDSLVRVQLAVSRDLKHWTRVCNRETFLDLGRDGAWDGRMLLGINNYLIEQEDKLHIYYTGQSWSHMDNAFFEKAPEPGLWGGVGLATLRRDGWVALDIGQKGRISEDGLRGGYFRTKTFTFTGSKLCLNLDSQWRGFVKVEFCEPHGDPIPGFTKEDCDPITVDSTRHVVTWQGNSDVSALQGRMLKMRVFGNCVRVYSFWFEL